MQVLQLYGLHLSDDDARVGINTPVAPETASLLTNLVPMHSQLL
jgi:hypothetical protein